MNPLSRTRAFFPVTEEIAYLNHAGVAPISTRVEEALARFVSEATRRGALHYDRFYDAEVERVRNRAATLLGARPEEIAFTKNTTEGIGLVAAGLDWSPGDRVVTCDLEYPSNVYPWWNLQRLGVETTLLPGQDGRLPLEAVETALHEPRTRLLALSSVEFGSGARNDLEALGRLCAQTGVLFCVDGIQSIGCLPMDVSSSGIDFLAADGHKWMLSVEGCALFYCATRVIDAIHPRVVGWRSVTDNTNFDDYHLNLQSGAGRFEEGTPNTPGIFALGAAIDLLLEIGVEEIEARVLELNDRLVDGLQEKRAHLRSPLGDSDRSGIVSFTVAGEEPRRTAARLRREGIFVIERRGGVRASPHFYNDDDEIDRLLRAL
ncbi:aminotransferase class V-fold PLP-dependent enzyme [Myxococcota bacterium]|nr:aminotransferase class V-fold PLP-dependent enzyme [Myxococcota bacterium]